MKNIIFTIAFLFFLLLHSCSNNESLKVRKITVDSSYLIIPIENKAPELGFFINDSLGKPSVLSYIRLARDTVDYWVKYPINQFLGKSIEINFEGTEIPSFGFNKINQANSLTTRYEQKYRPNFHFSPEYGWLNDPNGMVYFEGEYHLFYQYNPYGASWGNMHWGHAVSNDLLSWTYLGVPIVPDQNGAIFSGSTIIDKNNSAGFGKNAMIAVFTSDGSSQTQSIAYSTDRGRTFKMYERNPVIQNPGIPDFRDPKVSWNEDIKKWVMVLATRQTVTFYCSSNLKNWEKLSEFGDGIGSHGGVWECPDLFPIQYNGQTKWILLVSINPGGPNNGSATQYFIGNFNGKEFVADALPYPLWLDYGQDNYAGVTWNNLPVSDNRKIFIGWMSNWNYANDVPAENFRNAMTIPRELMLKNNGKHLILASSPVVELSNIEKVWRNIPEVEIKDSIMLTNLFDGLQGTYSIEMDVFPQSSKLFGFNLSNNRKESLKFRFNLLSNFLSVDRKQSGIVDFNRNFSNVSGAPIEANSKYHLKLIIDNASSELFVNNGELVLTNTFFPGEQMNLLSFVTSDGTIKVKNITVNKIN